ncbi:MAG: MFS transporter [Rhizobiales bacterium 62-17]|nr:MHS family MFS transporter [Hyphomicrobiales bacterium]OJX99643.1 MAG: MFS transporter [Rhizobiales bacterium 62-17]
MTQTTSSPLAAPAKPLNSPARVLTASLIGTTIEFYDFYIYATAAVVVFPTLFFPGTDDTTALLASFVTFSIAFFARPFGALVFGHFGDRVGRKTTLVAALLTMGISTVAIGLLPTHASVGVLAPLLLALCRFGQGFGLGGEWGGAVLLATENAPEGKRSWYGMFPQFGAPLGLFLASGTFWILLHFMSREDLLAWGWRIPFIISVVLIVVGLWVRLSISETPEFQAAIDRAERVAVPIWELLRSHKRSLFLGSFLALVTFVLFYLATAYLLAYNTKVLNMTLVDAIGVQAYASVIFGISTILAGKLGDLIGRRTLLLVGMLAIAAFSFAFGPMLSGDIDAIYIFVTVAMFLFGLNYGIIGAVLAAPFPAQVRYTGSSMTFNIAGILGASLAPYAAVWLQSHYGIAAVGYYLLICTIISLLCLLASRRDEV